MAAPFEERRHGSPFISALNRIAGAVHFDVSQHGKLAPDWASPKAIRFSDYCCWIRARCVGIFQTVIEPLKLCAFFRREIGGSCRTHFEHDSHAIPQPEIELRR